MCVKTCTFFGHRDIAENIEPLLREVLIELIEKKGVYNFLVGNEGAFDKTVQSELRRLKNTYGHIDFLVVLAYLPCGETKNETLYPEGLESVPKKFAIDYRNRWLIEKSNCVVSYVNRNYGGAAKFSQLAEKKGLKVINIAKINA